LTKVIFETVSSDDDGIRLDRWFKRHFPKIGHGTIEKALRKGQIKVDGKKAKSSTRLEEWQQVRIPPMQEAIKQPKKTTKNKVTPEDIKSIEKSVIYQDKNIVAINKPPGLPVQGGTGVKLSVDDMLDHFKEGEGQRPKLVHRIDKDTSGILLIAKNTKTAAALTEMFRNKTIEKQYLAAAIGCPKLKAGKIDLSLVKQTEGQGKDKMIASSKGQKAITYYEVIESVGKELSIMSLIPVTGRTHQLRVHMAEIGHPILGDGLSNKLHLHAWKIEIKNFGGKNIKIEAPLPTHIAKTLEILGVVI